MGDDNKTAAATASGPNRGSTAAIFGGALIGIVAVGNLTLDAAHFVHKEIPTITQLVKGEAELGILSGKSDLLKSDMYIAFDTGEGSHEIFRIKLRGREEFTGELTSLKNQTKGIVSGSIRAGTLTLSYASKDPNRPGFGTFTLRPQVSASESDSPIYIGMATFHDCKCEDGTVRQNGTIQITQVIMTTSPELPIHLKTKYFGKGPQKAPVLFPEDFQKFSDNSKSGEPCLAPHEGTPV